MDKPFLSLIPAEAGDGFLMPALLCLAARACGKELVINLCVTLFVNGDKKKDRLRRMRRWRLLHCFNLSQYITAWLASKKKQALDIGQAGTRTFIKFLDGVCRFFCSAIWYPLPSSSFAFGDDPYMVCVCKRWRECKNDEDGTKKHATCRFHFLR